MAWHTREADHEHHRRFEQLLGLHRLTEAWVDELREVGSERPSHFLDRGLSREITDQLWMLGSLDPNGLSPLLDDTAPNDVLDRLERTVWSVQAYTLTKLLERAHGNEARALQSVLEQTSWRLGRDYAEKHWAALRPATRRSVSRLALTLNDVPFGGSPNQTGILMTRVTAREARFELLQCAHQRPQSEVQGVADSLCVLHAQWLKGFAYGLNPAIQVEYSAEGELARQRVHEGGRKNGRCRCRWALPEPLREPCRPSPSS